MLDLIGNIRIDPNDKVRLKYLIASIRSFGFLRRHCRLILNLEGSITVDDGTYNTIHRELHNAGFDFYLYTNMSGSYGQIYLKLIGHPKLQCVYPKYILNFHEDHFCICDSAFDILHLLRKMDDYKASICKASFHSIEINSAGDLAHHHADASVLPYLNNADNHALYSRYYGRRFYIGTNFIIERQFAKKFWGRNIVSKRPHEYEVPDYTPELEHTCIIPYFEITAAIDDDHGADGSCLLKRKDIKFWDIYNSIDL